MNRSDKIQMLKKLATGKISTADFKKQVPRQPTYLHNGLPATVTVWFNSMVAFLNDSLKRPFTEKRYFPGEDPTYTYFENLGEEAFVHAIFRNGKPVSATNDPMSNTNTEDRNVYSDGFCDIMDETPAFIIPYLDELRDEARKEIARKEQIKSRSLNYANTTHEKKSN